MDNACPLRITAAAGTKLAGASSFNKVIIFINERTLQPVYKINLFCLLHSRSITGSRFRALSKIPHCWLISLGLISVPVWLTVLSNQLRIISLVGHYPTNNLILHKLILKQYLTFGSWIFAAKHYFKIRLFKILRQILVYYSPVRYVFNIQLACVKYTASVHPEPGSNSLYDFFLRFLIHWIKK